jgi:hypothetical protein
MHNVIRRETKLTEKTMQNKVQLPKVNPDPVTTLPITHPEGSFRHREQFHKFPFVVHELLKKVSVTDHPEILSIAKINVDVQFHRRCRVVGKHVEEENSKFWSISCS